MRLSGGALRNRVIPAPAARAVRPTPGRVKEAIFSIVGTAVGDARALDLYAGSGAIGFEALSRGARAAVFVENNARQAGAIRKTAQLLGLSEAVCVVAADAARAAASLEGRFDFVYADPPYALPPPAAVFERLRERGAIDADTIAIYERRSGRSGRPLEAAGFETVREERYGEVLLQFVRALPEPS
jgi:16S rRNA (guanine966-N2)-methyltransferase